MEINIKAISKGYFFGAMAVSAFHTVHSFEKMGLNNGEQWITPLAVDGLAFFALGLQSRKYSDSTNKIGLRLQIGAGIAQLVANVYAAASPGGMLLGLMVVGIYLLMEAIGPRIRTRAEVEAAAAKIEADAKAEADRAKRNEAARNRRAAAKSAPKHSTEVAKSRTSRSRTLKAV